MALGEREREREYQKVVRMTPLLHSQSGVSSRLDPVSRSPFLGKGGNHDKECCGRESANFGTGRWIVSRVIVVGPMMVFGSQG